jgi:hypothetical protein
VEIYKRETSDVVRRFRENRISHAECVASLDAALERVVHRMEPGDLPEVRFEILKNQGLISKYAPKPMPIEWPAYEHMTVQ